MKKIIIVVSALILIIIFINIAKRPESGQPQGPISMDELDILGDKVIGPAEQGPAAALSPGVNNVGQPQPQTSAEPSKPTNQEIQRALSGAGFYKGHIDGKIGPQTKKAIQDFQKANGLQVDGKVGARTWAVLGKYLSR